MSVVRSGFDQVGWLTHDGRVLASVEVPARWAAKFKGLIGLDTFEGAFYIEGAKSVHTFGMRFELDVAFLDADMTVVRTTKLSPNRLVLPVLRSKGIIEAESGAFSQWGLQIGDQLEIRT
jgi:uncharacterized membrane protein (UPF0127 family)